MIKMKDVIELANTMNKEYNDYTYASIYMEIEATNSEVDLEKLFTEDEWLDILGQLCELYYDMEYSTPTGIGIAAGSWIEDLIENGKTYKDVYEEVKEHYSATDWQ